MVVDHVFKFGVFSRLQMLLGKKIVIKHLYHGIAWICGCGDFGWQWRVNVLSDQPIVFFNRCTGLSQCDWTINAYAFGTLFFVECVAIFKIFAAIWMNPYIQFGATNKKCLFSAYLFWMGELRILESAKYLIFIDIISISSDCYIFFSKWKHQICNKYNMRGETISQRISSTNIC